VVTWDSYDYQGAWSAGRIIISNAYPTVTLDTPEADYMTPPNYNVTFTWIFSDPDSEDTQGAFRLQIDDDPDFWNPEIDTGKVTSAESQVTITLTLSAKYYYWRVMVWDNHDGASNWTAGRTIIVAYVYVLDGPYYENGTEADWNGTVTAYFEEYDPDQFVVNGTTIMILYDAKPVLFLFDFDGASRSWYVKDNHENITIFIPYDTCKIYEFTIQDYAGYLGPGVFLEAESYINQTFGVQTITRVPATGTTGTIKLLLQIDRSYILKLVGPDFEYQFGLFVADGTGETLVIREVAFDPRVKLAYQYVLADASRPDPSTILVSYQDNTKNTILTRLYIKLRNGTVMYESSSSSNLVQYEWDMAESNVSYYVELQISHSEFGDMTFRKALPPPVVFNPPFRLGFLGSSPVPTNQIVPIFLILILAACFSVMNAHIGIVIVCLFAGLLWAIGWFDVPQTTIAICLSLAILYALGRRFRKE